MNAAKNPAIALLVRYLSRLRYPQLLVITAALFLVDLAIPDLIPLADELLLALGTIVLATLRKKQVGEGVAETPQATPPRLPE